MFWSKSKKLHNKTAEKSSRYPFGPDGKRCYVVGDVHGRLDLIKGLFAKIEQDNASKAEAETIIVMLGDLIDRGPDSKGVLDFLMKSPPKFAKLINLSGNHEDALLQGLDGNMDILRMWIERGGMQCLQSYGVPPHFIAGQPEEYIHKVIQQAIPQSHVEYMRAFFNSARFGDYIFVHAGMRPGVTLEDQKTSDLKWIRKAFIESDADFGGVVVHGHTVVKDVEIKENRINLDTGAHRSGLLSALVIEGEMREILSVSGEKGELAI